MRIQLGIRILPCSILMLLLAVPSAFRAQAPPWKSFGSPEVGFRALFPSQPESSKLAVPAAGDTYELRSYLVQSGTAVLYVGVCDYGPMGDAIDPDQLLNSARAGALQRIHANILTGKKIGLNSTQGAARPGYAFEAEDEKLHFSVRMYAVNGVLYQTMVVTPLHQDFSEADRFLDSFELIEPAPATPVPEILSDWKSYQLPSANLIAAFPSAPSLKRQNIATSAGQFELRSFVAQEGSADLIAAACNYGDAATLNQSQALLDRAEAGAIDNLKARKISQDRISISGHDGVSFEAENATQHIAARLFFSGGVLYQGIVLSARDHPYAGTTRFLESLQLAAAPAK